MTEQNESKFSIVLECSGMQFKRDSDEEDYYCMQRKTLHAPLNRDEVFRVANIKILQDVKMSIQKRGAKSFIRLNEISVTDKSFEFTYRGKKFSKTRSKTMITRGGNKYIDSRVDVHALVTFVLRELDISVARASNVKPKSEKHAKLLAEKQALRAQLQALNSAIEEETSTKSTSKKRTRKPRTRKQATNAQAS